MERRIFISLISTGAILIILTVTAAFAIFRYAADKQVFDVLQSETEAIASVVDGGSIDIYSVLRNNENRRVTIVAPDGSVVFDTQTSDALPSHLDRPEISGALENGSARGKRSSETFGRTLYYYAVRLADGNVLRLAIASERVKGLYIGSVAVLALTALLLIAAAVFVSRWLTAMIATPIRSLISELDGAGAAPDSDPAYPEFRPMLDKIRFQRNEIRRQLAKAERENNRFSAIINNMDEGLVILSSELRVIMLNDSACKYLRAPFPRGECLGLMLSEVCADEEIRSCLTDSVSKVIAHDGRDLQLHVKQIENGVEQLGRIGLILDVTERAEIDRIKQEFSANVSHELKTPLTSISGYAEMIENGMAKGDDVTLFAGRIRRESARLLSLISDIIKLSKLDSDSDREDFGKVGLYSVCEECVSMLEISAKRQDITLTLEGDETELIGSRPELTELVYNLIDNAIRYNRPGGKVSVRVTASPSDREGAIAKLTVSDTGIGIPKEHLSRVFERFYRVDKSRSKETGGTGLGLAIVKHVAERNGAKLELESELGRGTTVGVVFYSLTEK